MKKNLAIGFVLFALLLAACSPARNEVPAAEPDFSGGVSAPEMEESGGDFGQVGEPDVERMVITNADLEIAVASPLETIGRIRAVAESTGGWVVNIYQYNTTLSNGAEVPEGEITIRVPAEQFNAVLAEIKGESDQPALRETITSDDVTADYTDLESQLRNLEAAEAQLMEIMEAATDTDEVLSVYNRLVEVRQQIEVIKGRMQYYEQSAAMSAIRVKVVANEAVQPLSVGGWEIGGVAKSAVQFLLNAVEFIVYAFIWIIIAVIPILILLLLPVAALFLIVRAVRRRNKARVSKSLGSQP